MQNRPGSKPAWSSFIMQTPGALKIDLHKSVVLCDGPPLHMLEEVMQLNWLDIRSQQGKHILIEKTLPSFASNAVKNNDFNSLLVLLEHVDVNSGDYNGHTPLHTACELGNLDMAMFLLGKGASPEFTNSFGQRPFHLAIKNRTVRKRDHALLHAWFLSGVDMDTTDYNGWTAMEAAVHLGDKTMITKLVHYRTTPLSSVPV
ncbi:60 kDa lysophospholipase-like isoform X3 [Triplophysa dalaica]|uniref:60 kDa lysophospholipase-like isoform X5 n=1 Tax=Triplophysa dalaica TaxID=1582913 RepID=UPI0024E034F1|nr:60 kDa lysophospholipase-like isoform X5 [Triplophysa dalaica]XP_056615510.1 60 kDa lysophospholipase-like isoform X3 [Triplophysa dalaica]